MKAGEVELLGAVVLEMNEDRGGDDELSDRRCNPGPRSPVQQEVGAAIAM